MIEFDWCVQKLETVDRVKMGIMAQDKYQRIMSRELSQLSERSASGHRVAEWVQDITRSGMELGVGRVEMGRSWDGGDGRRIGRVEMGEELGGWRWEKNWEGGDGEEGLGWWRQACYGCGSVIVGRSLGRDW